MGQEEYFGYESISKLSAIAREKKIKRVFVVADKGAFRPSGAEKAIRDAFREDSIVVFDDFEANPGIEAIDRAITARRQCGADAVIGAGGGTAIDIAKIVNVLSRESSPALSFVTKEKNITKQGTPLIAIPTTAGTGSEATCFAALYVDKKKHSLEHAYLLPDYAIVDPALTESMPEKLTAVTGLDALCQGIESYWSVRSTEESMGFATEAIRLALRYIERAVKSPDKESREGMSLAAHLSGKAINISKTTGPHAFSYYFTAHHGTSHGHAVGLTLGNFIVYNSTVTEEDVADERGIGHVKRVMEDLFMLLGVTGADAAREKILSLMKEIGLAMSPTDIGFSVEHEMEAFLSEVNIERLENNPRKVTKDAMPGLVTGS
jgi:alcohol dehydrogenase class IV